MLIVFFALCFAIDVPETYKFIRGQAEFVKDPNQSVYVFLGKEVRYYAFDVFWRLPPLLGWLPIWINDSLFFLMNEWMPMEFWNEDTQEFKTRPLLLEISRNLTSFMTFLIELIREILLEDLKQLLHLPVGIGLIKILGQSYQVYLGQLLQLVQLYLHIN